MNRNVVDMNAIAVIQSNKACRRFLYLESNNTNNYTHNIYSLTHITNT